jgi:hypothetical protein
MNKEYSELVLTFKLEYAEFTKAFADGKIERAIRASMTMAGIVGSMRAIREITEVNRPDLVETAENIIETKVLEPMISKLSKSK